jgi:hypothetical protein
MKLSDVPTIELARILLATEKVAGPDSESARILHRELAERRRWPEGSDGKRSDYARSDNELTAMPAADGGQS